VTGVSARAGLVETHVDGSWRDDHEAVLSCLPEDATPDPG
jgi:hypothetical protein